MLDIDSSALIDEAIKVLKEIVGQDPFWTDETRGSACYFCFGDFDGWLGAFKHEKDRSYVRAERLLKKLKKIQKT